MSSPLCLLEVLAEVAEPRSRPGRRPPLCAILCLAVVAMLAGARRYEALAPCGRDPGWSLAYALGFTRGKTPPKSTFSVLVRILDVHAFAQALSCGTACRLSEGPERGISLDGKPAQGRRDGDVPGRHLVAAYGAEAQAVLGQSRVDAKTKEHQAALPLLAILPGKGNSLSGDARFGPRALGAAMLAAGGDYVCTVKDDPPSLGIDSAAGRAEPDQAQRLDAAFSP